MLKPSAIIIGASGTGRELAELLESDYEVEGFLDDNKQLKNVIGRIEDAVKYKKMGYLVFSSLGNYKSMQQRRKIILSLPDNLLSSYFCDQSIIYSSAKAGAGCVVFPLSIISSDVNLESHVFIYHSSVISHDVLVGNFSIVSNSVTVSGGVEIGENCYLGAGCTIMENIRIGSNSIVAAGAIVIKNVPKDSIYITKEKILVNKYS